MIPRIAQRRRFVRDHRFTQGHLSHYLDGDLSHRGRRRVDDHVGACPQCRRVLATLKATLKGLRSLSEDPRPGVAEGVLARFREQ